MSENSETVFSLTCCTCDAGTEIASEEQAVARGWEDIQADDGPGWNHLGLCPHCAQVLAGRTIERHSR